LGFTQTWEYDNAGNITFRRKYAYTTGSLENLVPVEVHEMSGHSMYGMGDLFAEYDGQVMSYDAIGNPLYDGQWTYTWEHGRELKTMSRGATTWTYTYDANGMRTQRTGGYYTYSYIYNGSQLSQLTVVYDDGEHYEYHRLDFAYSANGTPLTVTYNDCTYHYVTNIQGDVIAILDDIGRLVCRYVYDAWGNVTDLGGRGDNVSYFNPLRYRGYVYDNETGLYYVSSRYYDPEIGRWINADGFVSTGQGVLGYNMFAYCGNNPVSRVDPTGQFWSEIWEFAKTAVAEIGKAMGLMSPAYAGCGGAALGDGPLPFGDIAGLAGAALITVGAIGYGIYQAAQAPAISVPKVEEKSRDIVIPKEPDNPVIFPVDPNTFNPFGLVKVPRVGTKNGAFISWMDPLTNTEVFRWDENPNYPNGPHYHINNPIYRKAKVHFHPRNVVPEPYATIYFPFG